jgi:hypothetical protein
MRLFRESTPEGELGVRVGLDDVKGFREGSVGWAAGHGYFEIEGRRVPVRLTAVLHQEDGDWKAVHRCWIQCFNAPGSAREARSEENRRFVTQ